MPLNAEQLESRRSGLGGTDGVAVVGLNPYKTPLQVYLEKTGQAEEPAENLPMRVGSYLEPLVVDMVMEHLKTLPGGDKVKLRYPVQETFSFSDMPYIIGHPDAILEWPDQSRSVVEIKTRSQPLDDPDICPSHYLLQALHYAGLVGATSVIIGVLVGNHEFHFFQEDTDSDLLETYYAKLRNFWENHVIPRNPPDMLIGRDTLTIRKLRVAAKRGQVVSLPEHALALSRELDEKKAELRKLNKRVEDIEAAIKWYIGEAEAGVLPDGSGFTLRTQHIKEHLVPASSYRVLRRAKRIEF